jgi:hypothetical protein
MNGQTWRVDEIEGKPGSEDTRRTPCHPQEEDLQLKGQMRREGQ